jgi:hypothetical protein
LSRLWHAGPAKRGAVPRSDSKRNGAEADISKSTLYGLGGKTRSVVFPAEMREPDVYRLAFHVFGEYARRLSIGEMTFGSRYSALEMIWIASALEHL